MLPGLPLARREERGFVVRYPPVMIRHTECRAAKFYRLKAKLISSEARGNCCFYVTRYIYISRMPLCIICRILQTYEENIFNARECFCIRGACLIICQDSNKHDQVRFH